MSPSTSTPLTGQSGQRTSGGNVNSNGGSSLVADEKPRLAPLAIPSAVPSYLRSSNNNNTSPARAGTPLTPGVPSPAISTTGSISSRRRAHTVGVSLRPRSSSRTVPTIQGLTKNYGLPPASEGEEAGRRVGGGMGIPEQPEDGVQGDQEDMGRDRKKGDRLDDAERGTREQDVRDPLIGPARLEQGGEARRASNASGANQDDQSRGAAATQLSSTRSRGRTRGSSIVDRIRNSIDSSNRERRESGASQGNGYSHPQGDTVRYEVQHDGADGRGDEQEDLDDGVVGMLDVMDAEVSTEIVIEHDHHPSSPSAPSQPPPKNTAFEATPRSAVPMSKADGGGSRRKRASTVAGLYQPSSPVSAMFGTSVGQDQGPRTSVDPPVVSGTVKGYRPHLPRILSQPSPKKESEHLDSAQAIDEGMPGDVDAAEPGYPSTQSKDRAMFPSRSRYSSSTSLPSSPLKNPADPSSDAASTHSLDLHVRQVLHASKRDRIKKGLKGLWVFLKTPMGFVVGIYGVLVVFWGAALVIILAGWIPMPNKWWQDRWVEICSQIVNGLFTITGVGLIPWRVQDTYRMIIISSLKRRTHIKRRRAGLPPIEDPNDIPDPKEQEDYVAVLTEKEQARLTYQQEKFAQSQTWYRPHATATHKAFPITWALWNTVLMDLNSMFQCMLCGCMWGLNQYQRPAWTTGSLIPLSFLCGIGAGVLIWQGSARTKKRETVEDKLRAALGVPLAIALPQTKDGTYITGNNKAVIGKSRRRTASSSRPAAPAGPSLGPAISGSTKKAPGSGARSDSPIPLNPMSTSDHSGSDKGDTDSEPDPDAHLGVKSPRMDGTVPLSKIVSPSMDRRATVTLGNVPDDLTLDPSEVQGRDRGQTVGHVDELKRFSV